MLGLFLCLLPAPTISLRCIFGRLSRQTPAERYREIWSANLGGPINCKSVKRAWWCIDVEVYHSDLTQELFVCLLHSQMLITRWYQYKKDDRRRSNHITSPATTVHGDPELQTKFQQEKQKQQNLSPTEIGTPQS